MTCRDSRFDIAKGVLIFLVVLGHSFFALDETGDCLFDLPIHKAIYSFHMPAFMLMSGYFFFVSNQKPLWQLCYNKIQTIGIPFLTFTVCAYVLMYIKTLLLGSSISLGFWGLCCDIWNFILTSNVMWFLASLLINCVLVGSLSRFEYGYVGYIVIFLVAHFIPVNQPYIYPGYSCMFPFFSWAII